ncbi:MBL fold metallo-hydrolase [Frondihabitans australicus]|uniref:Glyoxylase-like metal-dependent hydrolase (Beta-lactamase superfamily II) n=1 Tax=Frondihabitans australicus TaxID=386892 RepID=A0A495IK21_9MICO|nr:MBL fold metallo-hydrolase [Frondihabitans australicus]RKR75641.1 glyoxylase-like metal-dependent hydrolase (beta-lactamase superfamily II) [Frondihabitans australicus]
MTADPGQEPRPTSTSQFAASEAFGVPPLEAVRDDVWALGLAMPGEHIPASLLYLLRDAEGGLHLVDPGTDGDENFAAVESALGTLGAGWGDVRTITVTHLHPDHLGMAERLRAATGAAVQLSGIEADALGRLDSLRLTPDQVAARAALWGVPTARNPELLEAAGRAPDYPTVTVDRRLTDGQDLEVAGFALRALVTPGHTPGHLCLVDESRGLLLSGDHLLPTMFSGLGLGGPTDSNALADFVGSCTRVAALGDLEVLPGHGYRFRGLPERAAAAAEHHLRRTREVSGVLRSDPASSIWTVASQLTWTAGWENLTGFYLWSALSQVEMHRDYLAAGGAL